MSNMSSEMSSSENFLDSTDDTSFPDTDEVFHSFSCLFFTFCFFHVLLGIYDGGFC